MMIRVKSFIEFIKVIILMYLNQMVIPPRAVLIFSGIY
jgi:hypothetical protein